MAAAATAAAAMAAEQAAAASLLLPEFWPDRYKTKIFLLLFSYPCCIFV
jgi:hypothetical protein